MPAKILHIFPSFEIGGAQRRTAHLINNSSPEFRHKIVSLSNDTTAKEFLEDETIAIDAAVDLKSIPFLQKLRHIKKHLQDVQPDIIITYNWGSTDWLIANRTGPQIPAVHIQDGFGPEESKKELWRRRLARRFLFRHCENVITPSKYLQQIAYTSWKLDSNKIAYIPNAIAEHNDKISQTASDIENHLGSLGITERDKLVGTVAALRAEKRIDRLIRAFADINAVNERLRLVIIGDGPLRGELETLVRNTGTYDRIKFLGARTNARDYLDQFTLYALSSDTEQMPLSVMEAMAAGLVIVSTDVGDIKETVAVSNRPFISGHTKQALADNLLAALKDASKLDEIGAANKAIADEKFGITAMVDAYEAIFQNIMNAANEG